MLNALAFAGLLAISPATPPPPDRDAVEESFSAAVIDQYPEADPLMNVACDVAGGVVCFAQYLDMETLAPVVLTGIAPNRDPVDGPPIPDPMDWPWEIYPAASTIITTVLGRST